MLGALPRFIDHQGFREGKFRSEMFDGHAAKLSREVRTSLESAAMSQPSGTTPVGRNGRERGFITLAPFTERAWRLVDDTPNRFLKEGPSVSKQNT